MPLIIENGTGVAGANSYVTVNEFITYALERDIVYTGDEERFLILAMDYLESLMFIGIKNIYNQKLQWPRSNVVIDSYLQDSNVIPEELKKGQIEVALAIAFNNSPLSNLSRVQKRVKVGEIEVEYGDGQDIVIVRKISASLYKLLNSGLGGTSFVVYRG